MTDHAARTTRFEADPVAPLVVEVRGRRLEIAPTAAFTIGRSPECDLVVGLPFVSRVHATIAHHAVTGWTIRDEASTHGLFVDSERVDIAALTVGVEVLLGDREMGLSLIVVAGADPDQVGAAHTGAADGRLVGLHQPAGSLLAIGRDPACDLVIDDLAVSRRHAELRPRPNGGYEIVDLDSSNGTFVNGHRIDEAVLEDLDLVQIGNHSFRLVGGELEEYEDDGSAALLAQGLTVRSDGGTILLDGVTFRLAGRSLLAVVGPSGAGKSTLLRALTGDRPADVGQLHYGSRDVYRDYEALRSRIGFVPQDDVVHPELTVREELRHVASLRFSPDTTDAERERRIDDVLEELGLSEVSNRHIGVLSGGQRKRVSVAIELLTKPGILFLDEPTSGVDPGIERSMMRLLRQLANGDRIVVVITHSVQSIRLCDRLLMLAPGGRCAYFGPPQLASSYFGMDDVEDVFELLSSRPDTDWRSQFEASPGFADYAAATTATPAGPAPAGAKRPPPVRGRARQLGTLLRRNLSILRADRRNLAILLATGPALGAIMLLALPVDQFDMPRPFELRVTSQAALVLLMLVLGATWLGAITAVREIVKELPMIRREAAAGLSVGAYVAAKAIVIGSVTCFGSVLLVFIATLRQSGPDDAVVLGWPLGELALAIALTGIAAMAQGLLLSAAVTTADRAMSVLPILLIVQMVLAVGAVFPDVTDKPGLAQAKYVSSANWGMAAGSSTVDLNELQGLTIALADLPPIDLTRLGETIDAIAETSSAISDSAEPRFEPEPRTWAVNVGALVAITVVSLAATVVVLRRRVGR